VSSTSEIVLVWAPRGRDGELAVQQITHHGHQAQVVNNVDELIGRLSDVGCAVLTAEVLSEAVLDALQRALAAQPPWSDFPIVLFGPRGVDRTDQAVVMMELLGNVSILERPVNISTLLSTLTAALRGRRRQYEARDAIRRRDQFLAMLGHELRNPLAAITLAIETLPPSDVPQAGDKQRAIIARQARHLSRLVDDLLDVARVTSGKVHLQAEPVDVAEVVRRCLQSAELTARTRGIELRAELAPESLVVDGDLVRLEEVFNNLIANAVKYSASSARVTVRARRQGPRCIIEIVDTGIGIAPEMLARVFDLFAQVDSSLDRSQGGLGIGLTLVRSLIELHGGTVRASSTGLGHGSTFIVELPLSHQALRREHEPKQPSEAAHDRLRVLIVDDNLDVVQTSQMLLERAGYDVAVATDGAEAVAQLTAQPPDVAFVDIGLPVHDGYAVVASARAEGVQSYLVAMSGYGQAEDKQRALAAGFDLHLTKPVSGRQILDILHGIARERSHGSREDPAYA
jgi:signal transduction histidine kinase/ActR/RegA family two-component response regulator